MLKTNEVAGLKAGLSELNMKCQLARDNEVRFALQRGRLEAERAMLLIKLMETMVAELVQPAAPALPIVEASENDDDELPAAPEAKHKWKPAGLPTYQQMVQAVLEGAAPKWLKPKQITAAIRKTWWPDIPPHKAASTAWGMAQTGKLEKRGSRYRLKLNGYAREAAIGHGNGAIG